MKKVLLVLVLSISTSSICAQQTLIKEQALTVPKSIYVFSNNSSNFYDSTILNKNLRLTTLSFFVISPQNFYTHNFPLTFKKIGTQKSSYFYEEYNDNLDYIFLTKFLKENDATLWDSSQFLLQQ